MTTNDILFESGPLAVITLNRPIALNALSYDMFVMMCDHLEKWQMDDVVKAVLIKSSSEKAFCAGGDIRAIYHNKHKTPKELSHYFRLEYNVNKMIFHYPKPFIALMNGITMGGGVGVSVHGSYPIAGNHLRFAMPETSIGFFPDVGASYHLARLPHCIGIYLGLTGNSISAEEALMLKLVKYIVPEEKFAMLKDALSEVALNNTQNQKDGDFNISISDVIKQFALEGSANTDFPHQELIAHHFYYHTVAEIMDALSNDMSIWAQETRQLLSRRSPTSLTVALNQLHRAKQMTLDEVIEMDFHTASELLAGHDFYEGIRAAVIDKDKNPQWK